MQLIRKCNFNRSEIKQAVLALGNFEGLHLGHQALLEETRKHAKQLGVPAAVMTFEPHPLTLLRKQKQVKIFSLSAKIKFIKEQGIDILYLLNFNQELANLTATEFLEKILLAQLEIKKIVVGHDFIFGKNRTGNAEFLAQAAEEYGFAFTQIKPHKLAATDLIYSSTAIREALNNADLNLVKQLLGKNYFISGRVIKGQQLARDLGYPTANIALGDLYRPKFGVYAAKITVGEKIYQAVANLGIKPTFANEEPLLEVHLFDFAGELYGQKIKVELLKYLRAEQKFGDMMMLTKQIAQDVKDAQKFFHG